MQTVACPSCGAPVPFRSAASVMAVCAYCNSTLLKDADSVRDIGKMGSVLEDYSPIQLFTSGTYAGRQFTVVGRIQLRYDAGFWNEWYALFDEGDAGWLSDASGQYVFTVNRELGADAPAFERVKPGSTLKYDDALYVASDIRSATCTAGEGELPFRVGKGWTAQVADFRSTNLFITLDYSDGHPPKLFAGKSATLESLRLQLLRDAGAIAQSAGSYKGKTQKLDCPNCGGGILYSTGMTTHLACPTCHAEIDCANGDKAVVLQKHTELSNIETTLALGDVGSIRGSKYVVIGYLKCSEVGTSATWMEYLLFNETNGFIWLVESDQGWEEVSVLNEWPQRLSDSQARLDGKAFNKLYDYRSEVIYAAGAFNWRVAVGDVTQLTDFTHGDKKISLEKSSRELVWTVSTPVATRAIGAWFAKPVQLVTEPLSPQDSPHRAALGFTLIFVLLNLPMMLFNDGEGFGLVVLGLGLLWLPLLGNNADASWSEGD